ncbi:MAG: GTP-binding protein [Ferruginibacter sp.]|nr:GTP-binding protein [Cytophagales bacterium]
MSTFDRIPVTILTGFLGSGKTTLLNRLLNENHGRRFAIIENEFGEIGIDRALVDHAGENLFEMNNGCLCCTVKTDLMRILDELWRRRSAFDYVLIESTGLADPGAVVQTFAMDRETAGHFRLDGIVSLADARHLPQQLQNAREAAQQLRFADVVVLNKTDLVSPAEVAEREKMVRLRNLHARIYSTAFASVAPGQVLNIRAFDLDNLLAADPDFLDLSYPFEEVRQYELTAGAYRLQFEATPRRATHLLVLRAAEGTEETVAKTIEGARALFRPGSPRAEEGEQADVFPRQLYRFAEGPASATAFLRAPETGHYLFFLAPHPPGFAVWRGETRWEPIGARQFREGHSHAGVQSVAITFEGTLDGAKVDDWLTALLDERGDDLYRMKGILSVHHSGQKIIVQSVHRQLNSRYGADWGDQVRQNALVFIGRHLDQSLLEAGLRACLSG